MQLGLIGGTGVYGEGLYKKEVEREVQTPYGVVHLSEGSIRGVRVFFLPRHGVHHSVPPHRINYRANIWAMQEVGVEGIIATTAVGALRSELRPGTLVVLDSFLDFTSGRASTFFDGDDGKVVHTDMTYPYCSTLGEVVSSTCKSMQLPLEKGCYVCTNGPRFETAAEIKAFQLLGGDVVGMTGVPEVVLARELELCYAGLSLVTNLGAGLAERRLTHAQHAKVMAESGERLASVLAAVVERASTARCNDC